MLERISHTGTAVRQYEQTKRFTAESAEDAENKIKIRLCSKSTGLTDFKELLKAASRRGVSFSDHGPASRLDPTTGRVLSTGMGVVNGKVHLFGCGSAALCALWRKKTGK
jgi:hypothetical protein